ncbi:MAG: hypothetical protein HQ519_04885 [Planctomycetes bacterium]|nr:hypothetical protein [Planctomycetota bacterium]
MEMLTDNPIRNSHDDRFNFEPYAQILVGAIVETYMLPFTIGVYGAWGTGKSSLMYLIKEQLDQFSGHKTIWFNPWKYDKREDLWGALIRTILTQIKQDAGGNQDLIAKADKVAKSLLSRMAWGLLKKGISKVTLGAVDDDMMDNAKAALSKQDQEIDRYVNHFERDFAEAIKAYTDNGKLVIFMDDLDRCLPESSIEILESLKLFIGESKCVFVIGMDHSVVEAGITRLHGERIQISGRDYLDKIVQVPFFIPPVSFGRLRDGLQYAKSADYPEQIWRLLEMGLQGNPRKCKRFVNCYYLLNRVLQEQMNDSSGGGVSGWDTISITMDPDTQRFYLAKLLVIQMQFPKFYEFLLMDPRAWQAYEMELLYCPTPETRDEFLKQSESYRGFWMDHDLRRFMLITGGNADTMVFPPAPAEMETAQIIKMVNMVRPGGSEYAESMAS